MKITIISNGNDRHAELMLRKIGERIPIEMGGGLSVELNIDPSVGAAESYEISESGGAYKIIGSDTLGLYYGIGKFLHTARWTEENFTPEPPAGVMTPECDLRIMYFSIHNYNWYQTAPTEALEAYVEDMLLWGYNAIHCIVPVMNITEIGDEVFEETVARARRVFLITKKLGMRTSLGINPNQGVLGSPHEFDAEQHKFSRWGGGAGRNLCPSKPGALEHLKEIWRAKLERFTDIGIDYIHTWPYDEGGCCCDECWPWGAKKYCDVALAAFAEAKKYFPNVKTVVSTWTFDWHEEGGSGEYAGFYKRLTGDMSVIDYLMTDAHRDYPEYVLTHDVIKPIINFPEISMWGLYPWGGFGANPLPRRFQRIWDSSKRVLSGGMPYSEGLYEDILKIQFAGYYWKKDTNYREILSEYINYEYRTRDFDKIIEIMELIEDNHTEVEELRTFDLEKARFALRLANEVNETLPECARNAWRWRILYIRAALDVKRYEYFESHGMLEPLDLKNLSRRSGYYLKGDAEAQKLMRELCGYFHTVDYNGQNRWTHPPIDGGDVADTLKTSL